jgi:hypothetical protein
MAFQTTLSAEARYIEAERPNLGQIWGTLFQTVQ